MLLLLMAELMAAGLVGARLLGVDFATATGIAACAVLACFIVRGLSGAPWVNGVLFPIMLVAILVPLVMLSARWYGLPVPELAYANALWQVQGIEEKLIEQDLADPAVMRPMLTAFLALTPLNFLGVVLGLAAGVAALPSMLPAQLAAVPVRQARHAALWGLGFVALLLTLTPAVAAYAKLSFIQLLADRTPIAELPGWIFTYGKLGLVEICGRAATNAAAAVEACAALPETAQGLRLQDITLSPDIIVLALPDMAGLDHLVLGLLAAAALAAAIATANGPLSAIVRALGHDDPPSGTDGERRNSRLVSYAIAALALAAALAGRSFVRCSILDAAAYAFIIAAVGLFPALFAALWWRRANAYGAAAAMLAGWPWRSSTSSARAISRSRSMNGPLHFRRPALRALRSFTELEGRLARSRAGCRQGGRLGSAACAGARQRQLVGRRWAGRGAAGVAGEFRRARPGVAHHAGAAPGGNRAVRPSMLGWPP